MTNIVVSIVIPTYNRAGLLKRSINSVLNQTFENLEVIIIDDGSKDNTEEIVRGIKDTRIRYIKQKENRGATAARNTGIKLAQGKYVAFQDSDDVWLPEKLEKQVKVIELAFPDVGVVYSGFWKIKKNNRIYVPFKRSKIRSGNIYNELVKRNFVSTQTILLKKECFKKSGLFDENLPRFQDWDLAIRLSKYYNFIFIEEPLVSVYYTEGSISDNWKSYVEAMEMIIEKNYDCLLKNKIILSEYYFRIGKMLCFSGESKKSREYSLKSIKLNFLNIFSWILLVISFFGNRSKEFKKIDRMIENFESSAKLKKIIQ